MSCTKALAPKEPSSECYTVKHNLKQPLFSVIFIFRYLSVISVVVSPAGRRVRVSRRTSCSCLPPDVVVVSPSGRRGRVSRRTSWSCLPPDVVSPAGRRGRRLPPDVVVVCFSLRHVSKTVYKFAFFVVPLLV
jgi:hypothetical protein